MTTGVSVIRAYCTVSIISDQPGPEVAADLRGTYERWFWQRDLRAVVTRPDYYVFGAAASLDDLPAVVDSLWRQLGVKSPEPTTVGAMTAG